MAASSTAAVSLADLIVLGGTAAVEEAAKKGGHAVKVSFSPGRTDASQDQTDVESFAVLEPRADAFRNYAGPKSKARLPEVWMIDQSQLLTLTAPEMAVLLGGMRVLGANTGGSKHGVLTKRVGTLSNDFYVNLVDMGTKWKLSATDGIYEGIDRKTGDVKWTATRVDLVMGSNSQLRALAEVYACDDAQGGFVKDFAAVWSKVMDADRFDLRIRK